MSELKRADNRRWSQGFTLVEVLIALVVLLIGIYAMMAIFPRGYSAITASEMRTTASQLAESELARWKLSPESLPDAIVATDYDGALIQGTLVGTPWVSDSEPGSVSSMLLLWAAGGVPQPGNYNYRGATINATTFLQANRLPGALYSPENLIPCQYDGVSEITNLTRLAANDRPYKSARLHPNWQPDSLYLPRTVIGEQINIRRLNSQVAGVPFYLLSHAPLDPLKYEKGDNPSTLQIETDWPIPVYLDIYDARAWQYQPGGAGVHLRVREFSADGAGMMYFGPRNVPDHPEMGPGARTFKVDYTGLVNDVPTRIYGATVRCNAAGLSVDENGVLKALYPPPSDLATMRVSERLVQLSERPADPADWPRNAYLIRTDSPITGMIEFCPLVLTDPQPSDITLVKADYRVADWQILVFDVEVPPNGVVQLPITNLKGSNYISYPRQPRPQEVARGVRDLYEADGSFRLQAWRAAQDPRTWAYLVAVDRQNGDKLVDSFLALTEREPEKRAKLLPTNAYERRTQVQVDFRNGIIYFNYDPKSAENYNAEVDTPNRSGRNYRIFCRAEADWAVQLMPAARVYARSAGFPGAAPVGGQSGGLVTYSWVWHEDDPGRSTQLYFPLSESGQSVAVDYYTATRRYVEGEVHTIGGPILTRELGGDGVWVCQLSEPLQNVPTSFGPVNVRGVSVRARAVWVSRGRQSSLEDVAKAIHTGSAGLPATSLEETWRQVILTTFITRTPI